MKKQTFKPGIGKFSIPVFLLTLIFMSLNGCESPVEEAESPESFQVLTLNALPDAVQQEITATENELKLPVTYKSGTAFGSLIPTRVHQRLRPNGAVSYTLALSREKEALYYDNLVVNQDKEGRLKTHIVRYQPEASWFHKHKTEGLGYEKYSGKISIFNKTGTMLSSVSLISGELQKEAAKKLPAKSGTGGSCEVLDVEYVGGCAGDYCWWNEVIITVDCTGTGGETGGGNNTTNDNPVNPGGEEGGGNGAGGNGGGGNAGNGPGNTIDTVPVEEIVIVGPKNPINDVANYLNCFDTAQSATLTIYVKEPNSGTGDTHNGTFVGHAFVAISQGSSTSVYGFYPTSDWIVPGLNNSSNSVLGDDGSGNETYSASISTVVNGAQLQQIIDFSVNHNPTYHLNNYNCTDFAIDIGNLGGLNLPQANGTWPGGGGSNPGTLGMYIRNTNINGAVKNTSGGNAPSTNKGC